MVQTAEQKHAWYLRNRERILSKLREQRRAAPERAHELDRLRYLRHRSKALGYAKSYRLRNWAKVREQLKEQGRRNIAKRRARGALKKAVHDGRVIKPTICTLCRKDFKAARFIHGHHANYAQPFNVIWTCASCHPSLHR